MRISPWSGDSSPATQRSRRRLTRAAGADDNKEVAFRDFQIETLERLDFPVTDGKFFAEFADRDHLGSPIYVKASQLFDSISHSNARHLGPRDNYPFNELESNEFAGSEY